MNERDAHARLVVSEMMKKDAFSRWMQIQIIEIRDGYSHIAMKIRQEMLNGFGIVHGGILFSLADSAFAFSCNSDGKLTLALDTNISFLKSAKEGEVISAIGEKINATRKTGLYIVKIYNEQRELIAMFKGTSYKTQKDLL